MAHKIVIPVMLDEEEIMEYMYDALLQETLERRMADNHTLKVEIEKKKRAEKMARKEAKAKAIIVADNGHFFVGNINCRGALNVSLVERKPNRKRKRNFYSYNDYLRDEREMLVPDWVLTKLNQMR